MAGGRDADTTGSTPKWRLIRNVVWNFGGQIWGLSIALFTTPYIVHKLGMESYGLLMTVGIVTNYFWFMDLGLGQATVKYVAEHVAREEWDEVNRIFWTSFLAYAVLGILAALAIIAIAPYCVRSWLQIPPALQPTALLVFHLSSLGFVAGMINNGRRLPFPGPCSGSISPTRSPSLWERFKRC